MSLHEILKLGNPLLLQVSDEVEKEELSSLLPSIERMWELIPEFRQVYGRGRAIAAPQIGLLKRIICINTTTPQILINPEITYRSPEMIDLWDDCMCFPNLLVRLERHKKITISFYNMEWEKQIWYLEDDMSELIQHEYDHLDGILAITKAKNIESFKWVD
jgi:peptide deformylase